MSDYAPSGFNSFCHLMTETVTLFDSIISLENRKVDAINENNLSLLDQYMNDEQVYLLQMRGLDSKREKMQELMGASGLTFRQMIDKFERPEKAPLNFLYEELSAKSSELKKALSETKRHVDFHLLSISAMIEKFEGSSAYDNKGEKEQTAPRARFTPTKA